MVPEGRVLDRVLSGQGNAAEQNEEEDQVGEDRVIDNAVALEAEPVWGAGEERGTSEGKRSSSLGPRSTGSSPQHTEDAHWFGRGALQYYHCWAMTAMTLTPTMRHFYTAGCTSKALSTTVNF